MDLTFSQAMEMLVALRDQTSPHSPNENLRFLNHCLANVSKSASQFLQDMWVDYELGGRTGGFFVEFGACDGVWASNTVFLERHRGWTGILAEPGRAWSGQLHRNRHCFVDDRCVWTETGATVTFNDPAIKAHATIDAYASGDMHAATRADGERYPVNTVSLNDLLAHWRAPRRIDYLSIDTEGSELDILRAFDFSAYEIRLITVEHNFTDNRQPIHDLLATHGYVRKFEALSAVDDWYVKTY